MYPFGNGRNSADAFSFLRLLTGSAAKLMYEGVAASSRLAVPAPGAGAYALYVF